MNLRETAKFICGFEAFHALMHGYLAASGATINLFGITATPAISSMSAVVNGIVAVAVGIYAWRSPSGRVS